MFISDDTEHELREKAFHFNLATDFTPQREWRQEITTPRPSANW